MYPACGYNDFLNRVSSRKIVEGLANKVYARLFSGKNAENLSVELPPSETAGRLLGSTSLSSRKLTSACHLQASTTPWTSKRQARGGGKSKQGKPSMSAAMHTSCLPMIATRWRKDITRIAMMASVFTMKDYYSSPGRVNHCPTCLWMSIREIFEHVKTVERPLTLSFALEREDPERDDPQPLRRRGCDRAARRRPSEMSSNSRTVYVRSSNALSASLVRP